VLTLSDVRDISLSLTSLSERNAQHHRMCYKEETRGLYLRKGRGFHTAYLNKLCDEKEEYLSS
jgi:hypothetical protein